MAGLVPAIHFPEAVEAKAWRDPKCFSPVSGKWMAATVGGHDGLEIEAQTGAHL